MKKRKKESKIKEIFDSLGPGVVTGAADDDPSGIATYTQAGSQFGYAPLSIILLIYPFMTAVQEACARIGAVTGKGLAAVIKANYNKQVLFLMVLLVVVANTINIGADIGAMAEAAALILPINFVILTFAFTALILTLEVFTSYKVYSRILKWLVLSLFAYPITVFLIDQPWLSILKSTILPNFELSFTFFFIVTGLLGTTISPYMFFWEASQEVEEEKAKHLIKNGKPKITKIFIKKLRLDNALGMFFSNFAAWCIIVLAATVLNKNGITDVATAADAAKALEPLVQTFPFAGFLSKLIFATGIIGLGLLGVPILSASAAYAISEAFNMKEGLNLKFKKAHGFYGVITIATLIGLCINFVGIDPIKALVFTAVFNGITAIPLLFMIAIISGDKKIMGKYQSGKISLTLIWSTFTLMAISATTMFYLLIVGM